jgi:hypothetical protein
VSQVPRLKCEFTSLTFEFARAQSALVFKSFLFGWLTGALFRQQVSRSELVANSGFCWPIGSPNPTRSQEHLTNLRAMFSGLAVTSRS